MNSLSNAILLLALLVTSAYDIGVEPPSKGFYQKESFTTYLTIEQEGYPGQRKNMTTDAAFTCMTNRLVTLLPGVVSDDIDWIKSAISYTYGIWNHQQSVYYQFDLSFLPDEVGFQKMPKANVPGYNGVYSEDKNCQNCFPSKDVVYLRYKDIIAEDITSGKFLKALKTLCVAESNFATANYAYVSFSNVEQETLGEAISAHGHNLHLEYVWILMVLLIPVSIFLYRRVYEKDAANWWISTYDTDRAAELAAVGGEEVQSSDVLVEEGIVPEESDN